MDKVVLAREHDPLAAKLAVSLLFMGWVMVA